MFLRNTCCTPARKCISSLTHNNCKFTIEHKTIKAEIIFLLFSYISNWITKFCHSTFFIKSQSWELLVSFNPIKSRFSLFFSKPHLLVIKVLKVLYKSKIPRIPAFYNVTCRCKINTFFESSFSNHNLKTILKSVFNTPKVFNFLYKSFDFSYFFSA